MSHQMALCKKEPTKKTIHEFEITTENIEMGI